MGAFDDLDTGFVSDGRNQGILVSAVVFHAGSEVEHIDALAHGAHPGLQLFHSQHGGSGGAASAMENGDDTRIRLVFVA